MAHNLNFNNGRYSLFTVASTWHSLEDQISQVSNSEEVIKLAGLDYEVEKRPIYTYTDLETPPNILIDDKYATVRKDNNVALGVVGSRYEVLQNKDAFKFIDDIVGGKEAIYHSAGALGKGERIWMAVKLPQSIVIGGDDTADFYYILTNSHDGSKSVEMTFSEILPICQNTLNQALALGKKKQKVRHTASIATSLVRATDMMGITRAIIQQKEELYKEMAKIQLNDKEIRRLIEMALKPDINQISPEDYSTRFINQVDDMMEYTLGDETQLIETRKGTLFGAFQGVTGYYNNVAKYDSASDKLNAILYGLPSRNQQRALDIATGVVLKQITLS